MAIEELAAFIPEINMYQTHDDVIVETALPGVALEDVDVSIEDNALIIQGTSQKQSEVDEKDYWHKEVHVGSFFRQIPLPVPVMVEKVDAQLDNGLLKVVIPKATLDNLQQK